LFVDDGHGGRRLKTCKEHFQKFISEAWFAVRYAIEANQIRELPIDVMMEGCSRRYKEVSGNKLEVEPKEKMRETLGRSPDLFDCLAICVEGARQRGFVIAGLGEGKGGASADEDFYANEQKSLDKLMSNYTLTYD